LPARSAGYYPNVLGEGELEGSGPSRPKGEQRLDWPLFALLFSSVLVLYVACGLALYAILTVIF
jgi:hypothetical protein